MLLLLPSSPVGVLRATGKRDGIDTHPEQVARSFKRCRLIGAMCAIGTCSTWRFCGTISMYVRLHCKSNSFKWIVPIRTGRKTVACTLTTVEGFAHGSLS